MEIIKLLIWAAMRSPDFSELVRFKFPYKIRANWGWEGRWIELLIELELVNLVEVHYEVYRCYPHPDPKILSTIDLPF